jgi:NAD(P)-dependent dehydrogenase (short-subunit alcohol dehydrogenase family)
MTAHSVRIGNLDATRCGAVNDHSIVIAMGHWRPSAPKRPNRIASAQPGVMIRAPGDFVRTTGSPQGCAAPARMDVTDQLIATATSDGTPDAEAALLRHVIRLASFPRGGVAAVFGASGGIGAALSAALTASGRFDTVLGFSRGTTPPFELTDEDSIARAAEQVAGAGEIRLVILATGMLHQGETLPEKSWRELDADRLARAFAVNATGPALLMKHLLPRLPRSGKAMLAALSARVGSIGDNRLGGWYGYRASKAALNQLVHCAAIELARRAPEAICVALHPGTVATPLSAPFAAAAGVAPAEAARHLLGVIDRLEAKDSGGFYDWRGTQVPW